MLSDPYGGGTDPQILKPSEIECMVVQNHMFSDPYGEGTDSQILKPRDIVHGGTKSHVVRSGYRRHSLISSNPGIECMVAQNPILSDPDGGGTDPQTQR
jgi:hypothetical protein